MNQEAQEIAVVLKGADYELGSSLSLFEATLLLFLLDPEGVPESAQVECERALAQGAPLGLMQTENDMLLSLPHGHLFLSAKNEAKLKNQLADVLKQVHAR